MPTSSLYDPTLSTLFEEDALWLKQTKIPIVTVSGTFKEDLKDWYGQPNENTSQDVLFSRAHFSMAYGIAKYAWGKKTDKKKAWLVDPTNYVSANRWGKVIFSEDIAQLIARVPILGIAKKLIDKYGRQKLPILDSITPPLLYLFADVEKPILSFHVAAGNILAEMGKQVIQVITDPHVRDEYLNFADLPNLKFCVFDQRTKTDALEKAALRHISLDEKRVIVTGPPIDPRIILARKSKKPPKTRPIRIVITTGGLGTNKEEIEQILRQLLPQLRKKQLPYRILLYAGTQPDFFEMGKRLAKEARVKAVILNSLTQQAASADAPFRIIYHPQIFDANELLIRFGFPWGDVFMTKPSGDMAYDAIASGAALLTLKPWGVWEERIQEIFEQQLMSRTAEPEHIHNQLQALLTPINGKTWVFQAMKNAEKIDPLYLKGAKNIIGLF